MALAVWLAAASGAQQPAAPDDEEARLRAREQRAAERLKVLAREADALASQQRGLLERLRALELRRDVAAAEAARAAAALEVAEVELARLGARRDAVERAMAARRPEIQARLVALYRAGATGDLRRWLMVETVAEAAAAERLLAAVAARDQREFARFAALRAEPAPARPPTTTP